MQAYQQWRDWADPKVCCDYSFHMCVTYWNETVADQMQQVCSPIEEGGAGINSFKMFMVSMRSLDHSVDNALSLLYYIFINLLKESTLM